MKPDLRAKARQLRSEGLSIKQIEQVLQVSRSSVSLWVRDIDLDANQRETLKDRRRNPEYKKRGARVIEERHREQRSAYQEAGRLKAKEQRPLHMQGCMLYWAEGEKSKNTLYFVNSDPHMLVLFIRFLREELEVTENQIRLRIHCHTADPDVIEQIRHYWVELLQLQRESVDKIHTKQGSQSPGNKLPYGVCGIKVHSTELVQHIYGAIQEYGGFDNPAWLF